MKNLYTLLLALFLFTLVYGNNITENPNNTAEPSDTTELPIIFKKLKKTTFPNGTTYDYIYENELLVKVEIIGASGTTRNWAYQYDNNKKITKYTHASVDTAVIATIHYLDNGNIEIHRKNDEFFKDGDIKKHLLIENNLVKQTSDSVWSDNQFIFSSTHTFNYDQNKNKIEDHYVHSLGSATSAYTYDNMRNKRYDINESVKLLLLGTNNNNKTTLNSTGNLDGSNREYTYQYIYDADGYPIECTVKENDVVVNNYYLEYYDN